MKTNKLSVIFCILVIISITSGCTATAARYLPWWVGTNYELTGDK